MACLGVSIRPARGRAAWGAFGLSVALWACANLSSYLIPRAALVTGVTVSEFLYLAAVPFMLVGIGLVVRARVGAVPTASWFDATAAGLAVVAVALAFLAPALLENVRGHGLGEITNFVYPVGDLLMFGFVLGAILTHGLRGSRSLQLVGTGLLIWAATDTDFLVGTYTVESPMSSGRLARS